MAVKVETEYLMAVSGGLLVPGVPQSLAMAGGYFDLGFFPTFRPPAAFLAA